MQLFVFLSQNKMHDNGYPQNLSVAQFFMLTDQKSIIIFKNFPHAEQSNLLSGLNNICGHFWFLRCYHQRRCYRQNFIFHFLPVISFVFFYPATPCGRLISNYKFR